jgi:hypothetical protein
MDRPPLIPLRMVEEEGAKGIKSSLQLLMQQLAPVSMQMAWSLENFIRRELYAAVDCQALKKQSFWWLVEISLTGGSEVDTDEARR